MNYMDEAPYPEFETEWVKPEPPACPNCQCCSARLCEKARADGVPCALVCGEPALVAKCPCPSGGTP